MRGPVASMRTRVCLAIICLIVTALAIPLHVSASERDGLATQFQASAAEADASLRKELEVNLAKSITPSTRLDTSLAVESKHLENVDRREQQISIDKSNEAG